jgi:hypothetical protein
MSRPMRTAGAAALALLLSLGMRGGCASQPAHQDAHSPHAHDPADTSRQARPVELSPPQDAGREFSTP